MLTGGLNGRAEGARLPEQIILAEEMARADAPRLLLYFISLYHAALTIAEWGTPEQKARHLPAILAGEVWCQGFSEPNAGSDLASLRTRAERTASTTSSMVKKSGRRWRSTPTTAYCWCAPVNQEPKQAGITYLLMDTRSPGIVRRPIRQMTGDEEFAEIFMENVKIPVANRLGEENDGWRVAQTTLNSERGLTILELVGAAAWSPPSFARRHGGERRPVRDDQFRREAVDVFIQIDALRALVGQMMAKVGAGEELGGTPSIVKLVYSEALRQFTLLGERASAGRAHLFEDFTTGGGHETGNWFFDFMNSYQWSIAGGSNEIQRNIVAERVLKMPRERWFPQPSHG